MKNFWVLILSFSLTCCAPSKMVLLQADASQIENPRTVLEESVVRAGAPKFFYFDRSSRIVYSMGSHINGFRFVNVKMDELRLENPDLFSIVQCAGGKRCSSSNYDACKATIPLSTLVADGRQSQIVKILKSRGYPVIRVSFLNEGGNSTEMEVQYFTECDFINLDVVDNFPDLMVGTKAR